MPKPQSVIPKCQICGRTVMRGISICQECSRPRDQIQRGASLAAPPLTKEVIEDLHRAKAQAAAPEAVNHPDHYNASPIECIDGIEAALTPEEFRGFIKGNVLKYTWREKHKAGDQDLAKAAWYLSRLKK